MTLDYDVAILGGGCAGLSLAVALARQAPSMRVCILEARAAYHRDRTWCFWNTEPHPFEHCVTHTWNSWQLQSAGRVVRQQSSRYSYQHLPADHFYSHAAAVIAQTPAQCLALGTSVTQLVPEAACIRLETDRGPLRAAQVFDSRPPGAPWTSYNASRSTQRADLVQRFAGWHIRTSHPCFNPDTVQLMDFCKSEVSGRTCFFYTLPFSTHEALVEVTFLDGPTLAPADADSLLDLRTGKLNSAFEILYREAGALPMHSEQISASCDRVVPIGARGGRIRPSSGYAFLRIQRQSRLIARALSGGKPLPPRYEPRRFLLLDRIFLAALQQNTADVPSYFLQMFDKVPADPLVRFLSETSSPLETLSVASALPRIPLARAAVRHMLEARA